MRRKIFIYSKILSFGIFLYRRENKELTWEKTHTFVSIVQWHIWVCDRFWCFVVVGIFLCIRLLPVYVFLLSLNSSHLPFIKSIWDLSDVPWYRTYIRTTDRIKHINLIKTIPRFLTTKRLHSYIDLFIFILLWIGKRVYFSLNICSIVNHWH